MSWEAGGPVLRVNTLQLDREELLRWDECRGLRRSISVLNQNALTSHR